jgi:hypothetical protein
MAQHDYVIANGTGAAVRSDLNNGLAAIVSQNSGSSAPATTYAYMTWADTTAGVMKMRNGANNAWITLYQLDGEWSTIAFENGSAAAPSIYFKDSGTDTGIYSPGTDQVAISTGGTGRLFVDASGRVGVGTSSPGGLLEVKSADQNPDLYRLYNAYNAGASSWGVDFYRDTDSGNNLSVAEIKAVRTGGNTSELKFGTSTTPGTVVERVRISSAGNVGIGTNSPSQLLQVSQTGGAQIRVDSGASNVVSAIGASGAAGYVGTTSNDSFQFLVNNSEKARLDTSGRLLVGTSSSSSVTTAGDARLQIVGNSAGNAGIISLSRSVTAVNTAVLGQIVFADNVGRFAQIEAECDGTPGTNDYPGLLKFSTTADGAATPTERVRIESNGRTLFKASTAVTYIETAAGAGTTDALITGAHSSGTVSLRVWSNGDIQNTNNSYGAISDIKLKENIVDATSQWSDLKTLQVRKYNLKEGQTHTQIGLVAQEVELVSPGLVRESPDRDEDGNDLGTVTKSVNYSVLYMKAVKALQEAMERIETLEADVAQLKGA